MGLEDDLVDDAADDLVDYAAGEAGPTWLEGAFGDDPAREGQGTSARQAVTASQGSQQAARP